MKRTRWLVGLLLAGFCVGASAGCGSKYVAASSPSEIEQAAEKLPGGTNVLAALNSRDYEDAVAGLIKIQQSMPPEMEPEFLMLKQHVKSTLLDVSTTEPKANEALNTLRFSTQGR